MKLIRLVKTSYNTNVYKILLVRNPKVGSAIEKLGVFNIRKKKVALNIFRLLFWLSKKNVLISWSVSEILFKTLLEIFNFSNKSSKAISSVKKNLNFSIKKFDYIV